MEVYLPARFERMSMYELIGQVINRDMQPTAAEVIFNFKPLDFIEPVGITVLGNLVEWLWKRDVKVYFRAPNRKPNNRYCPIGFLDDSLFFNRYLGKSQKKYASPRPTTIPLEKVEFKYRYQWLEKIIQWLSRRLNLTAESLTDIKVCLVEIFNNIIDHSREVTGCVFAQHYPADRLVKFSISDFGVGIPFNVQTQNPLLSDSVAILRATDEGFSTKSSPQNRGAGLDTLLFNVVKNNQGNVYIHSNRGILECNYDAGQGIVRNPIEYDGFYPGTLIDIVFRTDTIHNISNGEEEFEW